MLKHLTLHKTWIILGVALTIGLLAALGARSYLNTQMAAMEAEASSKKVSVIVAKQDLNKGSKLSTENLAVRSIPSEYIHSTAISPEEFDRIEGQILAYNLKGGEMVTWSLLEGKRAPTFSSRIAAGHRAITVPVDEINSISGMLEPGDIIDLMITVDQKGKKVTFPLLQSVQVMATGQRAGDNPHGDEPSHYATITLNTTLEQAQNVIAAREVGKITALLRNPDDKTPMGPARGSIAALLGSLEHSKEATTVPVLYGGTQSSPFPSDAVNLPHRKSSYSPASTASAMPPMAATSIKPTGENLHQNLSAAMASTPRGAPTPLNQPHGNPGGSAPY